MPAGANRWAFVAAPLIAVVAAFTAIAVVPYGGPLTMPHSLPHFDFLAGWPRLHELLNLSWLEGRQVTLQVADLNVGLLYIFAVTALGVYGTVLAGWASNSKYALIGGLRSSAQMFSYEIALGLSWVGVIMLAGSFSISDIVKSQAGGFWHWNLFRQFLAFVIYFIAAAAEVSRTPFDLPEGETELVAGFHTEYSSMKFALLQMAEYTNMITVSVLTVNLFLGGWNPALPFLQASALNGLLGLVVFLVKLFVVLFVFIWLRGTVPRFRYDQLMQFGWKVLIPLAALNVLGTATLVVLRIL